MRFSALGRLTIPPFTIAAVCAFLNFGLAALAAWLLFGLAVLGIRGAYGDLADVASPQAALAGDRRTLLSLSLAAVTFATGACLILGVAAGRAGRLLFAAKAAPAIGAAAGLVLGLVLALTFCVLTTAWPRWELTCTWLALRRQLPWRLMSFLQDAHTRGVLRQAGAMYQFRHIELQRRLASRPSSLGGRAFTSLTVDRSSSRRQPASGSGGCPTDD